MSPGFYPPRAKGAGTEGLVQGGGFRLRAVPLPLPPSGGSYHESIPRVIPSAGFLDQVAVSSLNVQNNTTGRGRSSNTLTAAPAGALSTGAHAGVS